jgi:hypothetical protein
MLARRCRSHPFGQTVTDHLAQTLKGVGRESGQEHWVYAGSRLPHRGENLLDLSRLNWSRFIGSIVAVGTHVIALGSGRHEHYEHAGPYQGRAVGLPRCFDLC